MAECTHVSKEEIKRRERYLRAGDREMQLYDPFTWPYAYKASFFTAIGCVIAISVSNYWYRKPWYFSLYQRIGLSVCFTACGFGMGKLRQHHYRTRDAVVEHYMELHPNDFDRIRDRYGRPYSEVLLPWRPYRTHYVDLRLEEEKKAYAEAAAKDAAAMAARRSA